MEADIVFADPPYALGSEVIIGHKMVKIDYLKETNDFIE